MKFPRKQLEKYSKSSKQVEIYWYLISEYLILFNLTNLIYFHKTENQIL